MKFNRAQYDEVVLVLENDSTFYKAYTSRHAHTQGKRRSTISDFLGFPGSYQARVSGLPDWAAGHDVEDRDQIRRYFDDRYELSDQEVNKYAHIPSVWVNDPKTAQPHDEVLVEFKYTGTRAQADAQMDVYQQFADEVLVYTHPGSPGTLYRKGSSGFVEFKARPELPWTDCAKLTNNRLNEASGYVYSTAMPLSSTTTTTESITMIKPITITTKTFVGETDISTLADSTIYEMIAKEETNIRELEKLEAKPKRLLAEIDKRKAGITALVAHLDSKE